MILKHGDIYKDEEEILKDSFVGFKRLGKHGQLAAHFGRALRCTMQAQFAFLLSIAALAAKLPPAASVALFAGALGVLGALGAVVAVLGAGVYSGRLWKRRPRRAMIYWAWWPCWDFFLCFVGVLAGSLLGHYFWGTALDRYYQMEGLQTYKDVNPAIVPGSQLQDVGAIEFAENVDIDRQRGGCFVHSGHTFCVAPIVYTGILHSGLGNAPVFGSWDYFAVGVDCCTCPNQDFRCGDWRNPLADGGIRSIDFRSRPFYKLAVEDWVNTFKKEASHPLFFDWVEQPEYQLASAWRWAVHCIAWVSVAFFPIVFFTAVLMGQVLHFMVKSNMAGPEDTPAPPPGYEKSWATFLPEVVAHYREEQEQLFRLPISPTPWYGAPGEAPPPGVAVQAPGHAAA